MTLVAPASAERVREDALVRSVEQEMAAEHVPGLALAIVADDHILWMRGFGFADIARNRRVTADTVFTAASISKTVLAAAMMRAVEQRRMNLDGDVNALLPFVVRNPHAPSEPISPRALATHSAGIVDAAALYLGSVNYYQGGDNPLPLTDFLRDYLVPGGEYFDAHANFQPPGRWIYSNIGSALTALAVERATGTPFERYCRDELFRPLGMKHTSWHLRAVNRSQLATPYSFAAGTYVAHDHYGLATWPDGGLRTSVRDLSRFLAMVMAEGKIGGQRILAAESVREMLRPQAVQAIDKVPPHVSLPQALFWRGVLDEHGRPTLLGHFGSDPGTAGFIAFDPVTKVGVVGLMNIDNGDGRARMLRRILLQMLAAARAGGVD